MKETERRSGRDRDDTWRGSRGGCCCWQRHLLIARSNLRCANPPSASASRRALLSSPSPAQRARARAPRHRPQNESLKAARAPRRPFPFPESIHFAPTRREDSVKDGRFNHINYSHHRADDSRRRHALIRACKPNLSALGRSFFFFFSRAPSRATPGIETSLNDAKQRTPIGKITISGREFRTFERERFSEKSATSARAAWLRRETVKSLSRRNHWVHFAVFSFSLEISYSVARRGETVHVMSRR